MESSKTEYAEPKPEKLFWASLGGFPVDPSDAEEIASCQRLEREGFGLKKKFLSERDADPDLAVILPTGKVLSYSELVELEGKVKVNSATGKAINYLRAYRSLCPYAPDLVPMFFGRLPI